MDQFIFVVSLTAILLILILSVVSYVHKDFLFFPPPNKISWQYLVFWILFRVMFFGLLILSVRTFGPDPLIASWIRYWIWLPLCLVGFGFATYLSIKLGWKNSHGEKQGLMVSGWYQLSRNPVYVASILGMLGWGRDAEFKHLENAHVLGQESTYWHIKVDVLMLVWAVRNSKLKECFGQLFRIAGAAVSTPLGLVPKGNTGGANVGPFRTMPISTEHQEIIVRSKIRGNK